MNLGIRGFVRLAIVLGAAPVCALAQEPAADDEPVTLEEIVVTAQKRSESLRDVPISVEAVPGDRMQEAGIVRLDDLKSYVPNLQMSETGIANNIYIRGIGSGLNQGFEQSVSMYQDGVYHGRGHQSRMPFLDLARVEVLRGPQPILFGKNAVAGAVSMVANQPTREFAASARVSTDLVNNETTADAAVSGPFTDSLGGRLAAFYRKSEGYVDNVTLDRHEPRRDEIGARMVLAADLSEALSGSLRVEMGKFNSDGRQVEVFGETPVTDAGLPWTGETYGQAVNSVIFSQTGSAIPSLLNTSLDYKRSGTLDSTSDNKSREAALTLNYALSGGTEITSISAFSKYQLDETCDCDFMAAPLITAGIAEDYKQYSQELRFTSLVGGNVQWIGGAYFQSYNLDESDYLHVPVAGETGGIPASIGSVVPTLISGEPTVRNTVAGALYQGGHPNCAGGPASAPCQATAAGYIQTLFSNASNPRDFFQDSDMYSLFGQATWTLTDKWSASLGARWSHEKKTGRRHTWITSAICAADPGMPTELPTTATASCTTAALANGLFTNVLGIQQHDISGRRSEDNFAPMVNFQYRISSRSMAYGSLSRGYKAGGFDARSNRPPPDGTFEFEDERATAYEVGIKGESADGRADGSVAAYVTDYKDLQTSAFDGGIGFNVGNGTAQVRGIEFEGRFRPIRSLRLSASMGLLDFEWKQYNGQCSFGQTPTAPDGKNCDYQGKNNQLAPHFTGVVSAEHTAHLGSLALVSTVDVVHSSSYLESLNLDPMAMQKAYTKLNARIGLGDLHDHWQVAVIGKNLTDEQTIGYAGDAPLAQKLFHARSYYGFVDPPRSVAVEVKVRF
jgi:outer membrane receptor protein involved in Fe transport